MSPDVWYGALLSIPIGIGTALVTPVIQRKWGEKSRRRDVERSTKTLEEYRRIESLVNDPYAISDHCGN